MTIGSIDAMVAAPAAPMIETKASAKGQKQDLFMAMFAALLGTAETLQMPSLEAAAVTGMTAGTEAVVEAAPASIPALPTASFFGAQANIQWGAPVPPNPKPGVPAANAPDLQTALPATGSSEMVGPAVNTPAQPKTLTVLPGLPALPKLPTMAARLEVEVKAASLSGSTDIVDAAACETRAPAPVRELPQAVVVQREAAPYKKPSPEDAPVKVVGLASALPTVEVSREETSQQVQSGTQLPRQPAATQEQAVQREGLPDRAVTILGQPERVSGKQETVAAKEQVVTDERPVEVKRATPSVRPEIVEVQQLKPRIVTAETARAQKPDLKQVGDAGDARRKEVISQVMTAMRGAQLRNQSEVHVKLEPQELGEVWVKVSNQAGTLSADFKVTTDFARVAIAEKLPDLKQALIDSGLKVSTMTCDLGQAFDDGQRRSREQPERRPVYQNLRREIEAVSRPRIQVRGITSNSLDMIA